MKKYILIITALLVAPDLFSQDWYSEDKTLSFGSGQELTIRHHIGIELYNPDNPFYEKDMTYIDGSEIPLNRNLGFITRPGKFKDGFELVHLSRIIDDCLGYEMVAELEKIDEQHTSAIFVTIYMEPRLKIITGLSFDMVPSSKYLSIQPEKFMEIVEEFKKVWFYQPNEEGMKFNYMLSSFRYLARTSRMKNRTGPQIDHSNNPIPLMVGRTYEFFADYNPYEYQRPDPQWKVERAKHLDPPLSGFIPETRPGLEPPRGDMFTIHPTGEGISVIFPERGAYEISLRLADYMKWRTINVFVQ